jgi:hypothetical protein
MVYLSISPIALMDSEIVCPKEMGISAAAADVVNDKTEVKRTAKETKYLLQRAKIARRHIISLPVST